MSRLGVFKEEHARRPNLETNESVTLRCSVCGELVYHFWQELTWADAERLAESALRIKGKHICKNGFGGSGIGPG